ncbi:MAG TPA: CoA pyrophosphatase [Polyangiaceae bacterium]|nr:CoA pyrophosphatase [Polyangiaceae bacterium]
MKLASVLLPFFAAGDGAPELWLVRRADHVRIHSGQVALPGGKHEPHDPDPLSTALRECHEEIGLEPSAVEVLGRLDDCITVTGFAITPFVGWIANPFTPLPLTDEVARVFAVPLAALEREPEAVSIDWGEAKRIVLSYSIAGETVWGATAAILRGFVQCLASAPGPL